MQRKWVYSTILVLCLISAVSVFAQTNSTYGLGPYGKGNYSADFTAPNTSLTIEKRNIIFSDNPKIECSAVDDVGVKSVIIDVGTTRECEKTNSTGVSNLTCSVNFVPKDLGNFTVKCSASDLADNIGTATDSILISSTSGGTTTGGGGGAAAPAQPKVTNILVQVTPGVEAVTQITRTDIGVKEISIEVNAPVNTVTVTVTKLTDPPATVTKAVTGTTFQYLDVAAQNLPDTNIKSAKIKFNVAKSWLTQNGFAPSEISLRRFANSDWQKLSTQYTGETATEYQFEATTPGFSTFAIVGEKVTAQPPAPAPQPQPTPTPAPPAQPPAQQPAPQPYAPITVGTDVIISAVVLIILILIFFFYYYWRSKRKKE